MNRIHIAKKERPLYQNIIIRIVFIILALLVSALFIISITGLNPVEVFKALIKGTFGSTKRLLSVLRDTCFLWLISLGLTPAYKMRFWNTGAEGQILIGGIVSAALMIGLGDKIPNVLLIILMFIASFIAGGIWGMIPAWFKVKHNTNETLFTLMMNYIAIQIMHFLIDVWDKKQSHCVGIINGNTQSGWLPRIFDNQFILIYIIVIIFAIFMYIYLRYTKHGYEIEVVGQSERTALYAGINVPKTVVRTVFLSAGICAIAGFISVSGISHTIAASTSGGQGFTAIIVTWLGKFNVLLMAAISFLLQFLSKGASQIASTFNLNEYASDILIGIILFFIIASEFFVNYSIVIKKKGEN